MKQREAFAGMVGRVERELASAPGAGYTPRLRELEDRVDAAARTGNSAVARSAISDLEAGWRVEVARARRVARAAGGRP